MRGDGSSDDEEFPSVHNVRIVEKGGRWVKRNKTKGRMPKVLCKDWKDSGFKIGCGGYGCEREVCFVGNGKAPKIGLKFQVPDVRKQLLAVSRVVEKEMR